MKTKTKARAVIPGFRAVDTARDWKIKVARETQDLAADETLEYFRRHASRLVTSKRKTSVSRAKSAAKSSP